MKVIPLVCATAVVVSACSAQDDKAKTLPSEVTGEFEQAFASEDSKRAAALFTRDAEIFQQDRPAVQSNEIQSYLAEQMNPIILFDSTTQQSFARDDIGVEIGTYRYRDTRRGNDIEFGKYIHIWRKENGQWKLYRTMYNTDNPVRGLVTHEESKATAATE